MSMTLAVTANPSTDLPTYGRVLGMPACAQVDSRMFGSATAIQERAAVSEHVTVIGTRTKGAVPGNPAWRPPIC